jgi:hypothetical protein
MNILFSKKDFNFTGYDDSFFSKTEIAPSNFDEELDNRIHTFLVNNRENNIKTITIPISITDNYMDFSGLTFAHHVRLTRELNFCDVPIIFYGALELEQILKLTPLARILLSSNILYVDITKYSFEKIQDAIQSYKAKNIEIKDLLNYLYVEAPSNYDSHHSTANEWALLRYSSILEKAEKVLKFENLSTKIKDLHYPKTLHFKYLEAFSNRQKINTKKHTYTPSIRGIRDKRIAIIDDDINKGWFEFYDYLLSINDAQVEAYKNFNNDFSKIILIENIQKWLKETIRNENQIDFFIIDLRLHEDDFTENDFDKLSGIQLIKFIKTENPGIQIVVSTASNKVWSFQHCMKYNVLEYSVKESQETFNSSSETRLSLNHFCDQIEKASKKSFLAQIFSDIKQVKELNSFNKSNSPNSILFKNEVFGRNGLFDQLFNMLEIDPMNDAILNHCLLLSFQIFEKYCELESVGIFDFKNGTGRVCLKDNTLEEIFVIAEDNKNLLAKLRLIRGKLKIQTENSKETIKSFEVLKKSELFSASNKIDTTTLVKIISVLSFRHKIEQSEIERLIELRYFRSNVSAHLTGNVKSEIKLNSDDFVFIIKIFKNIFI